MRADAWSASYCTVSLRQVCMRVGSYHTFEGSTCSWTSVSYDVKGMSCIAAVLQALVGAVKKLAADPDSKDKNRIGVLLGTKQARGTKTLTHVMWVLFNLLPGKTTQKAHRHTPTALDFAVSAPAKGVTAACCFSVMLCACFAHALLSSLLSFTVAWLPF